jgi:hypothetical protein
MVGATILLVQSGVEKETNGSLSFAVFEEVQRAGDCSGRTKKVQPDAPFRRTSAALAL